MKEQYTRSLLDTELSNLEADIVWKNSQNNELKHKLLTDINKLSLKAKLNKIFIFPVSMCAVAAIFVIAFVLVKQEESNVSHSSHGSYTNGVNTSEQQTQDKDVYLTISREEQDLIERVNGNKGLFLTEEAVIPSNVIIPSIIGKPKITATKDNNRVLVSVTYPVKGDKFLSINTAINKQGSAKLAYESLVKRYSSFKSLLTIGNHQAILPKLVEADGGPQLIVVSNEFIYYISGGQSSDDLIKMAKLISFNK
jgi:hypothetical protein